jgi:hypothetical protein
MTAVSSSNGRDPVRVPRSGKPVVNGGTDAAPFDRWIARAVMSSDQ